MILTRRSALAGAAALPLAGSLSGAFAQAPGPFTANTYGGRWEQIWRNQIMPRFSRSIGGRATQLDIGLGTGWVTAFRAAGREKPPYSIFMANERYVVLLRQEGFFETLDETKVPNLAKVVEAARFPDNKSVTGMIGPIGIAYRTDMVRTPPRGWADLWNPAYKGQLALYSITNSASMMLLMWAGQHFGRGPDDIDAAVAKFAALKPFPQVAFSGQMTPLLTQGQVGIAPLDLAEVIGMKKRGVPVEFVLPEEGMMIFDQTFSILANGTDKETAYKYLDFMLSPEMQLLFAREFQQAPVNKDVVLPAEIAETMPITPAHMARAMRFDWALAARIAPALSDAWAKAI